MTTPTRPLSSFAACRPLSLTWASEGSKAASSCNSLESPGASAARDMLAAMLGRGRGRHDGNSPKKVPKLEATCPDETCSMHSQAADEALAATARTGSTCAMAVAAPDSTAPRTCGCLYAAMPPAAAWLTPWKRAARRTKEPMPPWPEAVAAAPSTQRPAETTRPPAAAVMDLEDSLSFHDCTRPSARHKVSANSPPATPSSSPTVHSSTARAKVPCASSTLKGGST
mmetsp:Transcript_65511/g.203097  ORF Transcript_65511/g.203097 Transcript_65511/m.203097 type:complete len:227 (-) Transcript_65511:185-865(-)